MILRAKEKFMKKLLNLLNNLKQDTKNKRVFFFVAIAFLFVSLSFANLSGDKKTLEAPKKTKAVLGKKSIQKLTSTPTSTPTVVARRVVLPTSTPTPTSAPSTNTSSSISSDTSSQASTPTPTQVPITSTPTPTASPSAAPTPTPQGNSVEIGIDYAGQKTKDAYSTNVETGQSAWEAIKKAVGIENVQYTDYGGNLGIFITGFNGINATGNQFYEFRVNGTSSQVGVSSYICNNADKLEFVLTTF